MLKNVSMQPEIPLLIKNGTQLPSMQSTVVFAACDAMCVYFLGKRYAGENHEDVVKLFKTIKKNDEELNKNTNRIIRIISIKNMAEYEERLVYRSEAERVLKNCERFLEYVKKNLP